MNYNQSNFYHANPYYKQDFIPDRAWYNRQAKSFPSEMPSGKDFLPSIGRKHFMNKFNRSQIEQDNILKSPQRFPFQNRIALNKTYMRNLNTIDIEGASSNTRVTEAVRNKFRAQDQINRRYNQSLQLKQTTQDIKRRQIAEEYYRTMREQQENRKNQKQAQKDSRISNHINTERSMVRQNPQNRHSSVKKDLSHEYKRYIMQNSSNKFHKDIPIVKQNKDHLNSSYSHHPLYNTLDPTPQKSPQPKQYQQYPYPAPQGSTLAQRSSGSYYKNQFDASKLNSHEQYQKILQYEQMNRRSMQNPNSIRKKNPNNLSINLAGQSIVAN